MLIGSYHAGNNIYINWRKNEKQFILSYDFLFVEIPVPVTSMPIQIAA